MKLIEADFVDLGDFFRARNTSSFSRPTRRIDRIKVWLTFDSQN